MLNLTNQTITNVQDDELLSCISEIMMKKKIFECE